LITLKIYGAAYKLRSSSLWSLLQLLMRNIRQKY
jgi:hypothetical protein